jgi:hypothetical protein
VEVQSWKPELRYCVLPADQLVEVAAADRGAGRAGEDERRQALSGDVLVCTVIV